MDTRLGLMAGIDIPIPELQTVIHQPSIREISYIGEEGFFIAVQFLCLDKKDFVKDESLLDSITNFQIFMAALQNDQVKDTKNHIIDLFALLFPKFKAIFTPQSLILNNIEDKQTIMIDENTFSALQDALRSIFCLDTEFMGGGSAAFNPLGKKAEEIAEKLKRGRQRVAAQKGEAQGSVLGRYISILTVGLHSMSLNNCLDLTLYQLFDLVERYQLFTSWDIDIRARLAGGGSDEKPEDWMKNIH